MLPPSIKIKNGVLPDSPGVYLMKDAKGTVMYVGKATSLLRRVSSYFQRPHDLRIEEMVGKIAAIDYIERQTAIEALILEANLIRQYWPKYNVREKDDKSFLYLVITKEAFPRPLLVRGRDLGEDALKRYKAVFGPYTSSGSLRAALDLLRRVFPWSTCTPGQKRPCFSYHLGLCPGVCIGTADKKAYGKAIRDLTRFFEGKKEGIVKTYRRDMAKAAKEHRFEDAASLRNKIRFLEHIQDIAVLKREDESSSRRVVKSSRRPEETSRLFGRIEGYDISHISGAAMVASMVVFEQGAPAKAEYRKFRIKTVVGSDDYAALRETLLRRFRPGAHAGWRKPDLILIDGGAGQVHVAVETLRELDVAIPVVGMAKGPERKRTDLVFDASSRGLREELEAERELLTRVRDEAHRFAVAYHRKLRGRTISGRGMMK